ncbi:hypothetical protein NX059_004677 [Plenodomus lindquistii]|nr:hypothetical protein NX059_004677 [Plenodomus lindquistii]
MRLSALLLHLAPLLPTALAQPCTTDEDCSLNGLCTAQTCLCDPGWIGPSCSRLDLAPATRGTGYNHTLPSPNHYKPFGNSSWGGQIVQDQHDPTLFHLLFDQFAHGCGLSAWRPTSFIARAESRSGPQGPYVWAQDVTGSFRHNAYVHWSPADEMYLLWSIGVDVPSPTSCSSVPKASWPNNISVSASPSIYGPWSKPHMTVNGTNPAPMPLYTASNNTSSAIALLAEDFRIFTAQSWNSSYTLTSSPVSWNTSDYTRTWTEDPFLWLDHRGNYHALAHWMIDIMEKNGTKYPRVGTHMFSRSLNSGWMFSEQEAFSSEVDFGNGDVQTFKRRERGKLWFGVVDGVRRPLYLVTGVQELGDAVGGRSYTLVQPVGDAWRAFEEGLGVGRVKGGLFSKSFHRFKLD